MERSYVTCKKVEINMQETDNYLQIMVESLEKKSEILDKILEKNEAQKACVKDKKYDDVNWDAFNVLVAEKETFIDKINELDEGFESIYARIKDEVLGNKEKYRSYILKLKELISSLTDKGVKIQTTEDRNRQLVEKVFFNARKEIKQQKVSMKVASNYYKTMSNSTVRSAEEMFLDQKK